MKTLVAITLSVVVDISRTRIGRTDMAKKISRSKPATGIKCYLSNEMIAAVNTTLAFGTGGVQVLVRASDADRARQILREQSLQAETPSPA
jgi:hypothetical protein